MRWTRGDTEAYKTFADAADRLESGIKEYKQKQAFDQIQNATPSDQYTGDQAQSLQDAAKAGYNITYEGDPTQGGGYKVNYPGQDGQPDTQGGLMTPQGKTFLNKSYASTPTEAEQDSGRTLAMSKYLASQGNWKDAIALRHGDVQNRAAEQSLELGKHTLAKAARENKTEEAVQKHFDDYQAARDPSHPDHEAALNRFMSRAIDIDNQNIPGTEHDDNNISHWDPESKQLIVGNTQSRTTKAVKLDDDPRLRDQVLKRALRANILGTSVKHWADIQGLDQKDLDLAIKGRHAEAERGHWDRSDTTQEGYRKDQHTDNSEKNRIAEKVGMANANNRSMYTPSFVHAGNLPDGTPVEHDQHEGGFRNAITGKPLTQEEGEKLKLTMKLTGDKPAKPVLSDAMNKDILEDYRTIKPGDVAKMAEFDRRFPGWRQTHGFNQGGLNLAPTTVQNTSGLHDSLSPSSFSRGAPQPRLNPQDWVRERSRSLMGGDKYRNINTNETMSTSDFESRTR